MTLATRRGLPSGVLVLAFLLSCNEGERGRLELTVRDAETGGPTPARLELLDEAGRAVIPDQALAVFDDCGGLPVHNWAPWTAGPQARWRRHREVPNPYTGTSQFYADGSIAADLPPGRYTVAATKGTEYRRSRTEVVVPRGEVRRLDLELHRWVDLPAEGWYGADDHLHIPRPHPGLDAVIATWMQAEDLHVANLLQMGLARDVHITPQHAFGERSVHRAGDTLLISGQENPRTHVLGHSIILGARHWIDFPADYLLYDRGWRAAREHGAANGYAHWGLGGAEEGLAVWSHQGLLDFLEVLGFGFPFYDRWYEVLDLGIRMGPTAGTDYPCSASLPGRERFYALLDGPLEYEAWIAAVRQGRTFVTNGPAIDLVVEDARVGDTLRLPAPGQVRVRGRVRFDPERDDVRRLELIRAGQVVLRVEEPEAPGEIRLDRSVPVEGSTWLALRATGTKRGETELDLAAQLRAMLVLERSSTGRLLRSVPEGPAPRPSTAHTAAIWVEVEGSPPLREQPRAAEIARTWLSRLAELEGRLDDDRLNELEGFPGRGDGVGGQELRSNRERLLAAIEVARRHHERAAGR